MDILDSFAHIWTLLYTLDILIIFGHFGHFWAILDTFAQFWGVLNTSAQFGQFWTIWGVLDTFGAKLSKLPISVQKCLKLYRELLGRFERYWNELMSWCAKCGVMDGWTDGVFG